MSCTFMYQIGTEFGRFEILYISNQFEVSLTYFYLPKMFQASKLPFENPLSSLHSENISYSVFVQEDAFQTDANVDEQIERVKLKISQIP